MKRRNIDNLRSIENEKHKRIVPKISQKSTEVYAPPLIINQAENAVPMAIQNEPITTVGSQVLTILADGTFVLTPVSNSNVQGAGFQLVGCQGLKIIREKN